jgi:deoxyribodipyrimidine photolyase
MTLLFQRPLQTLGGFLVLRCGDPMVELKKLVNDFDVDNVNAEEDYSPYARRRNGRISDELPR